MIKTIWGITLHDSNLRRAIDSYEKTLGLTKKCKYSSYAGFECGGVETRLIPKETVEIDENSPTVELFWDNIEHFCEMLKTKDVDVFKSLHHGQCGGRLASLKDPTEISWKLFKSIGKNISKQRSKA
jgi:hypothetical protein